MKRQKKRKIIALKGLFFWIVFVSTIIAITVVVILLDFNNYWVYGFLIGLVAIGLLMLFTANSIVTIDENEIELKTQPIIDLRDKKQSERHELDKYNNTVNILEIKKVFILGLDKKEKKEKIGSKNIFNKYLVFELNNKAKKYFYISLFSKKQICLIINELKKKQN